MTFVDLGLSAVANSYVPMAKADAPEPKYTLHTRVCEACWLVQVDEDVPIWENKIYRPQPVLCAGEKTIMTFRKWSSQFM